MSKSDSVEAKKKLYISSFELSSRTLNILEKAEIEQLGQLTEMQRSTMLKYQNVGPKTMVELDGILKQNGLCWKPEARFDPIHIAKLPAKKTPKKKYHNLRGENDKLIAEVELLTDQILKSNLERVRLEGKVQELEEQIRGYTTYLK